MSDSTLFLAASDAAMGSAGDARLLAEAFQHCGWVARDAVWDTIQPDGTPVLIRHTWDYHRRLDEFLDWIDRLEGAGTPVHDPPRWLRWNVDKRYLEDLAAHGVAVPPTIYLSGAGELPGDDELRERLGASNFVVKPTVAATAWRTARVDAGDRGRLEQAVLDASRDAEVMIQRFVPEVAAGEWSLVYLGGELSHTVLKRAASGDFRVQKDFGGTVELVTPPAPAVEAAERALSYLEEPVAYARVDGILSDEGFQLMELELIEPDLFLGMVPESARRLARWVVDRLREA